MNWKYGAMKEKRQQTMFVKSKQKFFFLSFLRLDYEITPKQSGEFCLNVICGLTSLYSFQKK